MERDQISQESMRILEFDRIRERLAALAQSEPGRALCLALQPLFDREGVARLQAETRAATELLAQGLRPPLGGPSDVRPLVDRASRGAVLFPEEIVRVRATLGASAQMRAFLEEAGPPEPLAPLAELLIRRPELERPRE